MARLTVVGSGFALGGIVVAWSWSSGCGTRGRDRPRCVRVASMKGAQSLSGVVYVSLASLTMTSALPASVCTAA